MNILWCLHWDCPGTFPWHPDEGSPDNCITVLSHGRHSLWTESLLCFQKWLSNVHVLLLLVPGFLFWSVFDIFRNFGRIHISSVQSLSRVWLFVTTYTAARQASLSITNSQSSLKLMSIESVMPSNHLILCRPLLLLPSIFPSLRVFSSESALHIQLQHQSFQWTPRTDLL